MTQQIAQYAKSAADIIRQLQQAGMGDFGKSPLEGVNPMGRVDVMAAGILRRMASEAGGDVAKVYDTIHPAVDAGLMHLFGSKK